MVQGTRNYEPGTDQEQRTTNQDLASVRRGRYFLGVQVPLPLSVNGWFVIGTNSQV